MKVILLIAYIIKRVVKRVIGDVLTVSANLCSGCPFYRVKVWHGEYFAPSLLSVAGVILYLGHEGLPCPNVFTVSDDGWEDISNYQEEDRSNSGIPETEDLLMFNNILASLVHDKGLNTKW
jgi:hypothetical protein